MDVLRDTHTQLTESTKVMVEETWAITIQAMRQRGTEVMDVAKVERLRAKAKIPKHVVMNGVSGVQERNHSRSEQGRSRRGRAGAPRRSSGHSGSCGVSSPPPAMCLFICPRA